VCNFQSSKIETDMMLSLPLPQTSNNSKMNGITSTTDGIKPPIRRSLYANLILNNPQSIKHLTASHQQNFSSSSSSSTFTQPISHLSDSLDSTSNEFNSMSRSKFYMSENNKSNYSHTNEINDCIPPYHVKIGVNIHISNDSSYTRDLINLNNSTNSTSTVINPDFNDLKTYFKTTYYLDHSDLVFVNLNQNLIKLNDSKSVKEHFFQDTNTVDSSEFKIEDSMCVIEIPIKTQQPLINIIALNVYVQQKQNQYIFDQVNDVYNSNKYISTFGLPFAILINRDCSYSELCKKLLESQAKYLKDKNVLKYKVRAFF
jgi:hypothetical protein